MSTTTYLCHYIQRLQRNNFDVLTLVSGDKGTGKSSSTVYLARQYNDLFSYICPYCGNEFYKSVYQYKKLDNGKVFFFIPDFVKNNKAWIECPIEYELDLNTKQKARVSGCGKRFKYKDRKKIKWDAAKFIAYDNADVIDKIHNLPTYSPLVCDEAVRFAASFEANKTESRELKKLFTVIRPKRFWIFFNIPDVLWIETKYREAMSSFWLRMIERGSAVLLEKDKSECDDKFHIKELQKLMGVVKYFTPIDKIKRNLRKHPCYFDTFQIPELPEKIYDDYELVRNAVNLKRKIEEKAFTNKDLAKIAAYNLLENWENISSSIHRSKEARVTYPILCNRIFRDPMDGKRLASEPTIRGWVQGIKSFIETKGEKIEIFDETKKEKEFSDVSVEL